MAGSIMNWLRGGRRPVPAPQPESTLLVIGDVHGRLDLLDRLLEMLWNEPGIRQDSATKLVFVGDLVDRGPSSAGVIDLVRRLQHEGTWAAEALLGNHEAMLLEFLDATGDTDPDETGAEAALTGRQRAARWLVHGGLETAASFGITTDPDLPPAEMDDDDLAALQSELRRVIGRQRLDWLRARPLMHQSGDTVVVHASYDPRRPAEEQDETELLWGAKGFLRHKHTSPPWIVHGHTIHRPARVFGCRIAVDSGAYLSDDLTCAVLHPGETPRLISTSPQRPEP